MKVSEESRIVPSAEHLEAAIVRALGDRAGIGALAVFGSRARGDYRPDSDLDVAVLPAEGFARNRLQLQASISAALADLVPNGRVDVVLLDEAPELLRQRVFESCRIVFLGEPGRWKDLRLRTMREHADREPYRRMLREALRRRLLGEV
ncbi:MAG: type VII toxin-antitoxin system MntA family adenylyltransferase antitoxin [Planctomycetota bacterium]